jgi:hypothetical protein
MSTREEQMLPMDAITRVTQIQIRAVDQTSPKCPPGFARFPFAEKSLTQLSGGERC